MSIFPPTHPPGGPTQKARINARKHLGPAMRLIEDAAKSQGMTDPDQLLGILMGEMVLLHADKYGVLSEAEYKRSLAAIWALMGTLRGEELKAD